jgi:hypothetical protein
MRRLVRITALALACGALMSSSACTGQDASEDPASLEGVEWHLIESSEASVHLGEAGIVARFDGSQMSGFSGVNQYTAPTRRRRTARSRQARSPAL